MSAKLRYNPTSNRAAELRAALADAGCVATVAKQRFALRIIARTDADRLIAASTAAGLGFAGPVGGELARSGDCLFAYDFGGVA